MNQSSLDTNNQVCDYELGGHTLRLHYSQNAFFPTTTTNVLFDALPVTSQTQVLDLGTGIGPIAIGCAKAGSPFVLALDVVDEACRTAKINLAVNQVEEQVDIVRGFLLEPLRPNTQFDIIVADVSGMSEAAAQCSPWYPECVPTGGRDGTELITQVLRNCKPHLKSGGCLMFPVITLSRYKKTLQEAEAQFGSRLEKVDEKRIPFHKDLLQNLSNLEALQANGEIEFYKKGSRYFWILQIYRASL